MCPNMLSRGYVIVIYYIYIYIYIARVLTLRLDNA